MMDGLSLSDQGRDQFIQCADLTLRKRDAGPGFGEVPDVFLLSFSCDIDMFFPCASARSVLAPIADVGWLLKNPAYSRLIAFTMIAALIAEAALFNKAPVGAVFTNVRL